MPSVSMVVCLHRERDFLSRLLTRAEGCHDDLVVVHDGPDIDDVRSLVEARGGRFFERPRKFSGDGHYIFGWQQARCDWIFRPDADEYPGLDLAEWLRRFRDAPEPDPAVSGFELIIPLWSGSTQATKRWPWRPTLIHRGRIRYIDVCEQWLIPDGRWVRVDEVLCHEPARKNFGASYLRHMVKRKRWLYATVMGLMRTPAALDCWRWKEPEWPMKWEVLRRHPLRTALIRLFTSYWGNGREMIQSGEPFKPLLVTHYPLYHWITCMAFRAVKKEWSRVQSLGLEPGGMVERGDTPQRVFILDGPEANDQWNSSRRSGKDCWIVSDRPSPSDSRRISEVRARVLMRLDDLLIHSPGQAAWAEEFLCRNLFQISTAPFASSTAADSTKIREPENSCRTDSRLSENSESAGSKADRRPMVSAIVSTYNAERFMHGCLEDLEQQTIREELEIVVVDSASPQNEGAIVKEFQELYGNIVYIRTRERETVYGAWNRGIRAARGKYVTSANMDDRHRADAFEILARTLEENPDATLAYADSLITRTENDTFECAHPVGRHEWPDFSAHRLLEACCVGPQPVWRREVHDEHGYFDEKMVAAGDYEFWLRIARNRKFLHVRQCLGLYLESQAGVERANEAQCIKEAEEARTRYAKDILATARKDKGLKRNLLRVFWRGE